MTFAELQAEMNIYNLCYWYFNRPLWAGNQNCANKSGVPVDRTQEDCPPREVNLRQETGQGCKVIVKQVAEYQSEAKNGGEL
jgi:hypothetical protein